MNIYGIGDLHLGSGVNKPMDIFGDQWQQHEEKIIQYWQENVQSNDIILIPGDISWGMRLEEARMDLNLLETLPGRKILIRGNHDYWWQKINYLNSLYKSIYFLQNTSCDLGAGLFVCGSRGWICPNSEAFSVEDEKIYKREHARLQLSLNHAIKNGAKSIIVMLHYPPTNGDHQPSLFTQLIRKYPVKHVLYGHIHDKLGHELCIKGLQDGVSYHLVAADYLNFRPKHITCLNMERTAYEITSSI